MKTRIISGFALIPLIALVFLGGWWLAALCLVVALIGVKEFFDGCGAMDVHPSLPLAYGLILLLYVANGFWPNQHTLLLGWVAFIAVNIFVMTVFLVFAARRDKEDELVQENAAKTNRTFLRVLVVIGMVLFLAAGAAHTGSDDSIVSLLLKPQPN